MQRNHCNPRRRGRATRAARRLVSACLMCAVATTAQAKEWTRVTVATEGSYAPWNLTRPDGTYDGFEVELLRDLCARARLECRLVTQGWDGMLAALQAGKFDVVMDALSITDERRRVIAFSRPYAVTPACFVALQGGALAGLPGTGTTLRLSGDAHRDAPSVAALKAALAGKRIGIQSSTIYAKFIYAQFAGVASISEYRRAAEHDFDLIAGRIDVVFDDATYFASLPPPSSAEEAIVPTGPQLAGPIWGDGEGFGFRLADTDLKARFDTAIAAAAADGTIARLSRKWLKLDVTP